MSPDILPGLAAGASAPPTRTGPAATGPPGDTGLSALFASLLAQSGGPQAKAGVIPGLRPESLALKTNAGEKPGKQAALASFSTLTLPIKAGQTRLSPTKPVLIKLNTMKPTLLPTVGVAAETQNAMDTVPVSGPRKAKTSETKPGGELPLPEARMIPPAASPAPPVLFIAITPVPAAATPQRGGLSQSATSGVPALPNAVPMLLGQAPAPVAAQATLPPAAPPAQASPVPVAASPPLVVSGAVGVGRVAPTLPALPKTWTVSTPTAAVKPAAATARPPLETAAPQPKPTSAMPYVVTGQVLTLPAQATAAAEPAPIVKAADATPLQASGPVPKPEKAPTAFLPVPKATDSAAKAPVGLNAPRPTMSVPDPTQGQAATQTATPQAIVMAALPIRQSQPVGVGVHPAQEAKTDVGASAMTAPQTPASKISLKSQAGPADNNTRTQAVTANELGPKRLSPEGIRELSERPDAKAGNSGQDLQGAATPVLTQAATQTVSAAPTPLTRTDRAEVVRQVADAVGAMPPPPRPGTASQMTLQLHPRDWGQLQISVHIAPSVQTGGAQAQTVTAHVVAASPQIKAILETGSGDLRHTLRQAGLHLDKLTVTVQAPEGGAKSGMTPGGHSLLNGGNGGQSQPDGRPNGNGPQPGGASFASWTGTPQGGRQDGQPAPSQTAPYDTGETVEAPTIVRDTPRRASSGQVDIRA